MPLTLAVKDLEAGAVKKSLELTKKTVLNIEECRDEFKESI